MSYNLIWWFDWKSFSCFNVYLFLEDKLKLWVDGCIMNFIHIRESSQYHLYEFINRYQKMHLSTIGNRIRCMCSLHFEVNEDKWKVVDKKCSSFYWIFSIREVSTEKVIEEVRRMKLRFMLSGNCIFFLSFFLSQVTSRSIFHL